MGWLCDKSYEESSKYEKLSSMLHNWAENIDVNEIQLEKNPLTCTKQISLDKSMRCSEDFEFTKNQTSIALHHIFTERNYQINEFCLDINEKEQLYAKVCVDKLSKSENNKTAENNHESR